MKIKRFNEANKTECQTPDAVYDITISDDSISCQVKLPFNLSITEEEAELLEANIHNSIEIVLSKYFDK